MILFFRFVRNGRHWGGDKKKKMPRKKCGAVFVFAARPLVLTPRRDLQWSPRDDSASETT